jgi:hypothetical protein
MNSVKYDLNCSCVAFLLQSYCKLILFNVLFSFRVCAQLIDLVCQANFQMNWSDMGGINYFSIDI